MDKKATATAMVLLLVIALIAFGAISALVKVNMDGADNALTGLATALPSTTEVLEKEEPVENDTDIEPPKEPLFRIR